MTPLYSPSDSKRIIEVEETPNRRPFRRDNGRLIHSSVFRRLQGKTQLFPNYESDFFRNRLTHSIEVAQIAKGIAENLNSSNDYFYVLFACICVHLRYIFFSALSSAKSGSAVCGAVKEYGCIRIR